LQSSLFINTLLLPTIFIYYNALRNIYFDQTYPILSFRLSKYQLIYRVIYRAIIHFLLSNKLFLIGQKSISYRAFNSLKLFSSYLWQLLLFQGWLEQYPKLTRTVKLSYRKLSSFQLLMDGSLWIIGYGCGSLNENFFFLKLLIVIFARLWLYFCFPCCFVSIRIAMLTATSP